nr:MAG TPA: hypothetical protein [Caudoviricetes sp.]
MQEKIKTKKDSVKSLQFLEIWYKNFRVIC